MSYKLRKISAALGYCSKPDFIIIGAQKAGTTALYFMLKGHSLVAGANSKEIHYFDNDEWYSRKKLYEYHAHFQLPYKMKRNSLFFEATPSYLYHPRVAKRLYDYNPNLRLIVVLRDPAFRALSAWTMYHHHFKTGHQKYLHDDRSFSEAIAEDLKNIDADNYYSNHKGYIKRGLYYEQIKEYLNYFNPGQILIIDYNELKNHVSETVKKICNFLNIPVENLHVEVLNKSKGESKNSYLTEIEMLKEFYLPHNKKLYDLLKKDFSWDFISANQ